MLRVWCRPAGLRAAGGNLIESGTLLTNGMWWMVFVAHFVRSSLGSLWAAFLLYWIQS
jgi:hypothetical protein